uniref:Uncharacterized protein n=1 Tax=Setaria viridis TaxID=4556 RepID=A0A4U6U1I2_SETVI|nr:hypothetical protein SEVIR_7G074800v2 [Setaria viridis]
MVHAGWLVQVKEFVATTAPGLYERAPPKLRQEGKHTSVVKYSNPNTCRTLFINYSNSSGMAIIFLRRVQCTMVLVALRVAVAATASLAAGESAEMCWAAY